jgi:predicted DNA binding CopG/RHH family protein
VDTFRIAAIFLHQNVESSIHNIYKYTDGTKKLKERDHFEEQDIDDRMILKTVYI